MFHPAECVCIKLLKISTQEHPARFYKTGLIQIQATFLQVLLSGLHVVHSLVSKEKFFFVILAQPRKEVDSGRNA